MDGAQLEAGGRDVLQVAVALAGSRDAGGPEVGLGAVRVAIGRRVTMSASASRPPGRRRGPPRRTRPACRPRG